MIANSLSITIAQRTREFATVRTIGGSRRQILSSVLIEALVIGVLASLVGLAVGVGLAKALFWLFDPVGFTLPNSGLILRRPRRHRAGCGNHRHGRGEHPAGVPGHTGAADRGRARGRVAAAVPLRPLPGPGLDPAHARGVRRALLGPLRSGLSTTALLVWMGLGALLIFLGVALLAERLVRPLASWLGWPGARVGGVAGSLARDNARRNPQRTASTAAALMIGLALVTLVSVLAAGIVSTFRTPSTSSGRTPTTR